MKFLKVCGSQVSFHPRIDEFQISGSGRAVTRATGFAFLRLPEAAMVSPSV
jgi:hypothetical protein